MKVRTVLEIAAAVMFASILFKQGLIIHEQKKQLEQCIIDNAELLQEPYCIDEDCENA